MDLPFNMETVDCYLQDLRESEVRKWCQKEGLDFSVPAQLAFLVMCPQKCFEAEVRYERESRLSPTWVPMIPRPSDPEDAWTELVEWRHPKINLNLLQLAIILCGNHNLLWYLWQPAFLREADYRDTFGRLVNHPFHLMLALRHFHGQISDRTPRLENTSVELLLEERTADLTAARLPMCPSEPTGPGFFVSMYKRLIRLRNPVVFFRSLGPLETDLSSQPLTRSVFPLPKKASPEGVRAVLCTILTRLKDPQAPSSTVELLWQVQSDLSSRGFSLEFLQEFQWYVYYSCEDQYPEDVKLLLCQLYWAVKKEQRWNFTSFDELDRSLFRCPIGPFLEICKFVPTEHLQVASSHQRDCTCKSWVLGPERVARLKEKADAVRDVAKKRTLQDHCVLSILDAVNGDARKVWGLSQLPEPLKQLFPVPFQELHKKLKAEEQSPGSAPE